MQLLAESAGHVGDGVRRCERCRGAQVRDESGRYPAAVVQVDLAAGLMPSPMDLCAEHYQAAKAFMGAGNVRVIGHYAAPLPAASRRS